MELRDYQIQAINNLRSEMAKHKHVILQAACGAGKTIISSDIASKAIEKGKKVLFLVNRRDLVKQTVDKYVQYGLGGETGIILAGEDSELNKPIQCASLQTYGRRIKLSDIEINKWFHRADLIIYDECHSANAPTYRKIIDHYSDKYIIGLSATPMGASGTGLGTVFDSIIQCVPTSKLVEDGFLVPAVHYAPSKPDMEGVGVVAGDWNKKQAAERVDKPKLIGDLLENWLKIASDRKTIIFAYNVKHSKHIKEKFERNGISIAHIDAHTKDDAREDIYNRFEHGDLQIITNVGVACEGSDLPIASCICIARPTRMFGRYLQMAGRGGRPYPGKKDYLLLDFAGCIDMHGFVDEDCDWSLNGKKPAVKKKVKREKEKHIMTCEMCSRSFTGKKCPDCGHPVKDWGKKIEALDAELVQVGKNKKEKKYTKEEKIKWFGMFDHYRRQKEFKPGWTAHKYKEKIGCWPKDVDRGPIEPDDEFKAWMKHLAIKYSKSKKQAEQSQ